jgi:hypothetical protein
MKIAIEKCRHKSGEEFLMYRIYRRLKIGEGKYTFIPDGWRCPDCGQVRSD